MARYKLYFLNVTPPHFADSAEFEAADDEEAESHAAQRSDGRAMELWNSARLVRAFAGAGTRKS
jgi:hypothetical protein